MKPSSTAANPTLEQALLRLHCAVANEREVSTCHRHWRSFILQRDRYRCVVCDDGHGLQAHHVIRQSFMPAARFQTGNGATLCCDCHREAHVGFNGRADLSLPMDAEGGEKPEAIAELFRLLAQGYRARHSEHPEFYFLCEGMLTSFKKMQGFDATSPLVGTPIEQAWYLWDCPPQNLVEALIRANVS